MTKPGPPDQGFWPRTGRFDEEMPRPTQPMDNCQGSHKPELTLREPSKTVQKPFLHLIKRSLLLQAKAYLVKPGNTHVLLNALRAAAAIFLVEGKRLQKDLN